MYKNRNALFHILGVIAFCYTQICSEHNINTIRHINLQPFSNKHLFVEHPIVLLRGVKLRHFFHPKCLGCLGCVICNSKSFHSFILKLRIMIVYTLKMCSFYFVHI